MQSATTRSEEVNMKMKLKERTIELWMSKYGLSEDIKREIKQNVKCRLEENNDVYVENLLDHLAPGLRKEVKHRLCLDLLKTVSSFAAIGFPVHCKLLILGIIYSC